VVARSEAFLKAINTDTVGGQASLTCLKLAAWEPQENFPFVVNTFQLLEFEHWLPESESP